MTKQLVFTFKLDADDRERLLLLSRRLQRTQADTVRWLIRQATGGPKPPPDEPPAAPGEWGDWTVGAPGREVTR